MTRLQLENEAWLRIDSDTVVVYGLAVVEQLGAVMLPIFGLMVLVAILVNLGQVGFLFLPKKVGLDLSRISVLKGIQRLFSLQSTMRLLLGFFKISVVATVALYTVWTSRDQLLSIGALGAWEVWLYLLDIVFTTSVRVAMALLVLAIIDYAYQKWKQEQDMRMTTQEMRDEMKEAQGDPQMAARRKAVQRQLVMNRMNSSVPKAQVVVTNPTELAIAIQYDHETMDTPIVVAKGAGTVAQRIRRLALEHGIPIVERKELARAMYHQVEIGKPILPDQYAAMAEVLRYVYELKGTKLPGFNPAA